MSLIFVPRPLQRLNQQPLAMLTFLMERAQAGNLKYVIGGATALKLHGITDRFTKDVDFYIPPRRTFAFAEMITPYLNQFRNENITYPGLRGRWTNPTLVKEATKMTIYYHYDEAATENSKADISESPGLFEGDDAFVVTLEDDLPVASVPVLTVFKLCALCRGSRNGQPGSLTKDGNDLLCCLMHLTRHHQVIPLRVQEILNNADEEFSWAGLRQIIPQLENADYIKAALVQVGFCHIDVYG